MAQIIRLFNENKGGKKAEVYVQFNVELDGVGGRAAATAAIAAA